MDNSESKVDIESERADVIREISANDRMVTPRYPETYFLWGSSAIRCIRSGTHAVGMETVSSILDFPCGHGRVLRSLQASFPKARLTACDIDRDGVDFCSNTFGAKGVYSSADLSEVQLGDNFDLIWVGSLFTHLPKELWSSFFTFLADHLAPNGLLFFTVHGPWYAEQIRQDQSPLGGLSQEDQLQILRDYDRSGFGFKSYSGRDGYGLSLSSPTAVLAHVHDLPLRLVSYLERGWRGHQDVVACQNGFTTPDL